MLGEGLKTTTTLTYLHLTRDKKKNRIRKTEDQYMRAGNEIGDHGAVALGEGIKINRTVTNMDLSGDYK